MKKITVWLLVLSLSMGSTLDVCSAQTISITGTTTQGGGGGKSNTWGSTIGATLTIPLGGGGSGGGKTKTVTGPPITASGDSCLQSANNAIAQLTTWVQSEITALNLTQAQQQALAVSEQQTIDAYLKPCE